MRSRVLNERKGFTLVEVLVALAILGVAIVAIIKLFPDSLRQARVAAERTIVAELASSRLGQVRAAGAETLLQGNTNLTDILKSSTASEIYGNGRNTIMYDGYASNVQRMSGSDETFLQRVTFTVRMPDGRLETFVTYVAKQ